MPKPKLDDLFPTKDRLRILDEVQQLESRWAKCTACSLCSTRTRVVGHRGDVEAPLFVVGEAPGEHEDREGRPFVGNSGRVLDSMLKQAGVDLMDVFITNVVACRPPDNREPEREEMKACWPRLEALVEIMRPRAVLMVGRVAANKLAGVQSIKASRGEVMDTMLLLDDEPIKGVPTFHPSYLLRNGKPGNPARDELEAQVIADIKAAKALAEESR